MERLCGIWNSFCQHFEISSRKPLHFRWMAAKLWLLAEFIVKQKNLHTYCSPLIAKFKTRKQNERLILKLKFQIS